MSESKIKALLAHNLRELMRVHDIKTAVEVSSRTRVSDRMIGYILKQERAASIEILEMLARGFRIKPYQLLIDRSTMSAEELADQVMHYTLNQDHLDLISDMSPAERKEAQEYAEYLISKRPAPPPDGD